MTKASSRPHGSNIFAEYNTRRRPMEELCVELLSSPDKSENGNLRHRCEKNASNPSGTSKSSDIRNFKIRARFEPFETVRKEGSTSFVPLWMYPPAGTAQDIYLSGHEIQEYCEDQKKQQELTHSLSEWPSTAICGNDILASVLYSSGIVASKSGKLMPIAQLLVSVVLYFFRYIYEEAVTAIPLNGGSYNVLLNTTSKRTAAIAATLGIISYLATGVVSATSAVQYLNTQVEVSIVWSTILLLSFFAGISIVGIGESALIALLIFCFHVVTLTLLSVICAKHVITKTPGIFWDNVNTAYPSIDIAGTMFQGNFWTAIFFGYSSAMLGITGFETSAQFIEQQQPGVFRKTLRNMWLFATVFNFTLSCLALAVLPLGGAGGIISNKDVVLALMAEECGGKFLSTWVSLDAFIVLAGGVLTSYVGITGLARRLAYDRVLPEFFTHENSYRHTNHNIIISFFVLQSSLVLLLNADATILAGVFTFAFLGVMALFAFGCMLLKLKRENIPRDISAPWWNCIFGFCMVLVGLCGNLLGDPAILTYFSIYFIVFAAIVFIMLDRTFLLRVLLFALQRICPSTESYSPSSICDRLTTHANIERTGAKGGQTIVRVLRTIHSPPIVFYCKYPDLSIINKAVLYVRRNEQTHTLRIVHICPEVPDSPSENSRIKDVRVLAGRLQDFREMVAMFDLMYPKLTIDFISVQISGSMLTNGLLYPDVVQYLSHHMEIPLNMMFIRQPSTKDIHNITALGVRVITK